MNKTVRKHWNKWGEALFYRLFLPFTTFKLIQNYIRLKSQIKKIIKSLESSQELVDTLNDNAFDLERHYILFGYDYATLESVQISTGLDEVLPVNADISTIKRILVENITHIFKTDNAKVISDNTHMTILHPTPSVIDIKLIPTWFNPFRLVRKDWVISLIINTLLVISYFVLSYLGVF